MAAPQISLARKVYAVLVAAGGYSLAAWGLIVQRPTDQEWGLGALLVAVAVLLGTIAARLPRNTPYLGLEGTPYYASNLTLPPGLSGLVALLPFIRWRIATPGATNWIFLRNSGMYAAMGAVGAWVFAAAGGHRPLDHLTPANVLALIPSFLVVRLINDAVFLVGNALAAGPTTALNRLVAGYRENWLIQGMAYLPAIFTAMVWSQMRWEGLAVWLPLLAGVAFGLYQVLVARSELTRRLSELNLAHTRLTAHDQRATTVAGQLGMASGQLTGYAERVAISLHEQHLAIAQITATVEQLAQQAHYIADAARGVNSSSDAAVTTASRGQQAAARSVAAMDELERSVQEMYDRMTALESRSRLIRRTLQTINSIAGETHLLALNATIEAAGAGERGRRFAVVAQQINALADQALHAAEEIQATVHEIDTATAATKQVIERGLAETRHYTGQVDESRRAMEVILSAVGRASEMAQQIRQATEQQTAASTQVTNSIREIGEALGLASTEGATVHVAAEHLRRLAGELRPLEAEARAVSGNGHQP